MTRHAIRVVVPYHLQTLAKIAGEISLEVSEPATHDSVIDALERAYPMLRGTVATMLPGSDARCCAILFVRAMSPTHQLILPCPKRCCRAKSRLSFGARSQVDKPRVMRGASKWSATVECSCGMPLWLTD